MGSLGPTELIIIGVVLVLLFGATRLPQTAKGLGQALRLFKKEIRDDDKEKASSQVQEQPAPPPTPPAITSGTPHTGTANGEANGAAREPSAAPAEGTAQPAKDSAERPVGDSQRSS